MNVPNDPQKPTVFDLIPSFVAVGTAISTCREELKLLRSLNRLSVRAAVIKQKRLQSNQPQVANVNR